MNMVKTASATYYYYYHHHFLSQVFFLPWTSALEPVVNPTTQASSLSL
jgi:hypothetical protein